MPPGEILRCELMEPLGISQNQLARDLDVPVARISELVHGRRSVTANTALRLEKYFGVPAQFWSASKAAPQVLAVSPEGGILSWQPRNYDEAFHGWVTAQGLKGRQGSQGPCSLEP